MRLSPCLFGRCDGGSIDRERAAARLCWRQHSLENDFDELLGKGQPRYANQIAGALRPRLGVGFFAHLARDRKRLIDIEDIERLFHHMVEGSSEPSSRTIIASSTALREAETQNHPRLSQDGNASNVRLGCKSFCLP